MRSYLTPAWTPGDAPRSGSRARPQKSPRRGSIIILTAILLTVILGMTGLAVDAGNLAEYRHRVQSAADAAALAGARELKRNTSISNAYLQNFVNHDASANGFTNGVNGVTVTTNHAPTSGTYSGNSNYVEVRISRSVPTYFMGLFGRSSVTVGARAVAGYDNTVKPACVQTLGNVSKAFQTSGSGGVIDLGGCGIFDNSARPTDAFFVSSGWTINAQSISVVGGTSIAAGVTLNLQDPPIKTNVQTQATDPFSSLVEPTAGACLYSNLSITSGSRTLDPGTYCGGIDINGATVTFNPGMYIMKDGPLTVKGSATVTGTGVTFFYTGNLSAGGTNLVNTSHINLTAPTSGTYNGILFATKVLTAKAQAFESDDMVLNGAIYFPGQDISWKGGSNSQYTMVVSYSIKFGGNASLRANWPGAVPGGGSSAPGNVSKAE